MRQDLVDRISAFLHRHFPGGQVHCFGSFASGLYLPTADMDLVFLSDDFLKRGRAVYGTKNMMFKLAAKLEHSRLMKPGTKEVIASARVPIIKFVDKATDIKVDISFEKLDGPTAVNTFKNWKQQFPAMPVIVTVIKQFLSMRGLNEVFTGGLGGFTVTCLVTSLLQHLPAVQSGNMIPEHNLGEILLHFLDLYGSKFNINVTGISMEPAMYFPKVSCKVF